MSFDLPVNPFIGHVRTTGSSGAQVPIVQLKNPVASGKRLVLFKARVTGHVAGGGAAILVKIRRTRTPTALASTIFAGRVIQSDARVAITPVALLQAALDTAAHFEPAENTCQSAIVTVLDENQPSESLWPFRQGGAFPLSILPGSAFEAFAPVAFVGHFRLNAVWDEVAYP